MENTRKQKKQRLKETEKEERQKKKENTIKQKKQKTKGKREKAEKRKIQENRKNKKIPHLFQNVGFFIISSSYFRYITIPKHFYDIYYLSPTTLRSRNPDDVATYRSQGTYVLQF